MAFIDTIKDRARKDKKTIVLPESMDKRTYAAAEQILNSSESPMSSTSFFITNSAIGERHILP